MKKMFRIVLLLIFSATGNFLWSREVTVFTFEDAEGVAAVTVRSGVTMSIEKWPDAFPGPCAKLTFVPYVPGQERWPAVIFNKPYLDGDWSAAVEVGFDVYSETGGMLRMHFNSNHGTVHRVFRVEPGRTRLTTSLEDGTAVEDFHILMEDPPGESVFYIGDISVEVIDFIERADAAVEDLPAKYIGPELEEA